jgi:hypothetical protein
MTAEIESKTVYDVIVIDSGYFESSKDNIIVDGVNLSGNGCATDIEDKIGHGTEIVNIISRNSNKKQLKVFVIKTCDSYDGFGCDVLLEAVNYIIAHNIKSRVVNISMGLVTVDNYNYMLSLFDVLKAKNMVVISAFDNLGAISYPAALPNVIGIDCMSCGEGNGKIFFVENGIVNVICMDTYYRTVDHMKKEILVKGASFATAYISSLVISCLTQNDCSDNYKRALDFLRSVSNQVVCFKDGRTSRSVKEDYASFLEGVQKAIVFPFNKEVMSIAKFEKMLPFEIVGYYDFDLSFNKNCRISDLYPHIENDRILHGYSDIDWTSDFDLLICGHCKEYSDMAKVDILDETIKKCLTHGKKMYAFDDISGYLGNYPHETIFYPYSEDCCKGNNYFGKLRVLSTPVLGVFGTSSKQGKYTLQLGIKSLMEEEEYRIGGIATEPSGYLFGYDYVHAMGYGGTIKTTTIESVRLLNEALWNAEKDGCDLLMVGSQAGTVPYDIININNLLFNQYDFLVATHPDAVILCVNLFDTEEYIVHTINFIESIGYSKVIAVVVFPVLNKNNFSKDQNLSSSSETEEFIKMLKADLKLPVIINDCCNYGLLVSIIKEYFGSD